MFCDHRSEVMLLGLHYTKRWGMAEKKESGSGVVPFIPSEINIYPKSNFLIGSKYKSTLLENKIMAVPATPSVKPFSP